jgi:lipopolysaccharide/colanic/teichoic acid biosynthesis glycosyltransferase/GT2 family glycosyltransferase
VVVVGDDTPTLALALAPPLVVLACKVLGLYDRDENLLRKTTLEELPALVQVATTSALLLWILGEVLVEGPLLQGEVVFLWLFLFVSLPLTRTGVRRLAMRSAPAERCLVIGDVRAADLLRRSLQTTRGVNATLAGRVSLEIRRPGGNGVSTVSGLPVQLRDEIDRVVIAPGHANSDAMLDSLRVAKAAGVQVSVLPRLLEVIGSSAAFDDVDGMLLLGLPRRSLTTSSKRLKRAVDTALAGCLLLVLAPVLAGVAAGLRISSSGPVFVRHSRLGADGRPFEMLGLRTSHAHDGRSRLERIVRRAGLNRVPQLINVLRGEMCLVGPRPQPVERQATRGEFPLPRNGGAPNPRFDLAPGVTGLWLIHGAASASDEEVAKLDYLYATNWSVWLDARILLRTLIRLSAGGEGDTATSKNGSGPPEGALTTRSRLGPSTVTPMRGGALSDRLLVRQARIAAPPSRKLLTITAVVPATNRPATLEACLTGLRQAKDGPDEIVVVEDPSIRSPAAARNEGAARASGDVLVFVDADVVVHRDAFARIREAFAADPELVGLFGSYDDGLPTAGRVATFRNLLHHHVHQRCAGQASTFWSGLGAVRRDVFLDFGGFDAKQFAHASVEDIELGMRLASRGHRLVLNPSIQGTHLKDWTVWQMVHTDFLRRGVPWVRLILRNPGELPTTTLNLSWQHRLSALLSLVGVGGLLGRRRISASVALLGLVGVNHRFYLLLGRRHGMTTLALGFALHLLHHLVSIASAPCGVVAHLRERTPQQQVGRRPPD